MAVIIESRAWWAIGAAPVLGRWGAGMALCLREPARADGLGARYASREGASGLLVALVPVLAVVSVPFPPALSRLWILGAGMLVAWLAPRPFARRFGGITGDVLGATILLGETFVLVVSAFVGRIV